MLKYQRIIKDISDKIQCGDYQPYSQLPSMAQLCHEYGVSKITVKKALDELEANGLISRRAGSGAFVKMTKEDGQEGMSSDQHQMAGFTTMYSQMGKRVESKVYDFSVVRPPEDVAAELDMEADEFAYYICRVRLADGVPHNIEYTYMPINLVTDLKLASVEGSIYAHVEDDLGLKIGSAHRTIRAVMPTDEEQRRLGVSDREPLLEVRQVGYLDDGRPFESSVAHHAHGYEFRSISTK